MIKVRNVQIEDLEQFNRLLNSICNEKLYLALLDGIPLEKHRPFFEGVISNGMPQVMAVNNDEIVGWCDVLPNRTEGYTHTGRLGMGDAKEYRGQGLGNKLLSSCIEAATEYGVEKIELEVFSDNIAACALYEKHGFTVEGVKSKSRKVDEKYQDIQLMGLWLKGEKE